MPVAAVADVDIFSKALTNVDDITEDEPVNVCLAVNVEATSSKTVFAS